MRRRIGGIILLAAMIAAGCAPKRVTSGGVVNGRTPEVSRSGTAASPTNPSDPSAAALAGGRDATSVPEPGPSLPPPEPLSRSGRSVLPGERTREGARSASLGRRAADLARAQIGKPYQWGAAGPDRFDCSGLVQYVYSNLGIPLPRVSSQQAGTGVHVDRKDLAPGDLVFFRLNGSRVDHVGIYVGQGRFIHAPNRDRPVGTDSLHDSWWSRRFKGGRRVG